MAGLNEKLYPPIIEESLPAFYKKGAVTTITVPFSMSGAVSINDIKGFSLKIKTVYSNSVLHILTVDDSTVVKNAIEEGKISFNIPDMSKIKIGQFLKVQLAYINTDNITGYYSTVGIVKYTSKPNIYIENNETVSLLSKIIGYYEPGIEDQTERPYSYRFSITKSGSDEVLEDSGWLLHNSEQDDFSNLNRAVDVYFLTQALPPEESYIIKYEVKSINNLEESCISEITQPEIFFTELENLCLNAENVFDEGYINLFLTSNGNGNLNSPISIAVFRSDQKSDFSKEWLIYRSDFFESYEDIIDNFNFKDFSVEQGITYQYSIRIQDENKYSTPLENEKIQITADFEDMFLWDGEKQIKVRFNPKVSSFKIDHLEQKTDTIGGKYPVIFRNGRVEYKEFPISGLISYKLDNNEFFIKNAKEELNIILNQYLERQENPAELNNENIETLDLTGYNIRAEREFKLQLLEWLGDGKIKLFRSPAEGNYLVRLLNISLSPEDKLSRMLHTFSCTAYEVKDCSYNNLADLGFFKTEEKSMPSSQNSYEERSNEDEVGIIIGPYQKSFIKTYIKDNITIREEISKFYSLTIKQKERKPIYKDINGNYFYDSDKNQGIFSWNPFCLYEVYNNNILEYYLYKNENGVISQIDIANDNATYPIYQLVLQTDENSNFLQTNTKEIELKLNSIFLEDEEYSLEGDKTTPNIDEKTYSQIIIGPGLYLEYAGNKQISEEHNVITNGGDEET